MSVVSMIKGGAHTSVVVPLNGVDIEWKIRRVGSRELTTAMREVSLFSQAGASGVREEKRSGRLAEFERETQADLDADRLALEVAGDWTEEADVALRAAAAEAVERYKAAAQMAKVSDVQIARITRQHDALVCAGVVAAREPGGEWEPVSLVLDEKDATAEVSCVSELPPDVRGALMEAVVAHATGEEDRRLAASFPAGRHGTGST